MKNNKFPESILNTISLGDSIEKLKELPDSSVDMIFSDPPYNMQIEGQLKRTNGDLFDGVEGSEWDEFASIESYEEFTKKWLAQAQRVLKKDRSSIWVIGSFQNLYIMGAIMQKMGFWIINDIVWSKSNPTPNFTGSKFTNKQETLIWATPSKKTKYKFNYKTMKQLNGGKQMTSVWEFPVAAGNERIKDDEGNKLHPTQKPEKLLYNVIISSTKKGDIIVDPFMGSGTTGAMAKRLERNFYGIDLDQKYIKYAMRRINNETPIDDDYVNAKFDIRPKRVRFKQLVDKGYIDSNEKIWFKKTDIFAQVSDKKELVYDGKDWGISKLGGVLSGLAGNANGWDVWYVERDNKRVSISKLREEYRKEND